MPDTVYCFSGGGLPGFGASPLGIRFPSSIFLISLEDVALDELHAAKPSKTVPKTKAAILRFIKVVLPFGAVELRGRYRFAAGPRRERPHQRRARFVRQEPT
jgi:hypothetical protein